MVDKQLLPSHRVYGNRSKDVAFCLSLASLPMEAPSERKRGKLLTKNIEVQWLRCTLTTPWTSFRHLHQMLPKERIQAGHKLAFMRPFT